MLPLLLKHPLFLMLPLLLMLPLPEEEERHDNMTVEQNASVMLTEYIWLQVDQSLKKKIIGTI